MAANKAAPTAAEQQQDAAQQMLSAIQADAQHHVTAAQAAELTAEKMFAPARIDEAITELRKGTMPGDSGVTTDLLATPELRALLVAHISRLACKCMQDGILTPAMREVVISILYKGKGARDLCKSHRPVSLTDATCRVIDKALQLMLQLALNKK